MPAAARQAPAVLPIGCCDSCHEHTPFEFLNRNLHCVLCAADLHEAEAEEEDDDDFEPSEAYLRRWEGTFSI